LQWIEGWLGGVITTHPFFNALPGHWQAQLLATMGMAALPPSFGEAETPKIITPLPNGLHFRRGVQNMRVRDMEFQIPIPGKKAQGEGSEEQEVPDWSIVQKAWWDVINLVYATASESENPFDPSTPMRLTLELRIMGGSDVLLAPQFGNKFGTVSIEILSVPDAVSDQEWSGFCQKVADLWGELGGEGKVRPHWAKEWEGVRFGKQKMDAKTWMREVAYSGQITDWKRVVGMIGERQGWGIGDLRRRFSNEIWDEIIFKE